VVAAIRRVLRLVPAFPVEQARGYLVRIANIKNHSLGKLAGLLSRFEVYLIDDFTASGTTFIRKNADGEWKGKLKKFNDLIRDARAVVGDGFPIAENYELHIHHYISSDQAKLALMERLEVAKAEWSEWTSSDYKVTESLLLPDSLPLAQPGSQFPEAFLFVTLFVLVAPVVEHLYVLTSKRDIYLKRCHIVVHAEVA
jgi:hypothetical protein